MKNMQVTQAFRGGRIPPQAIKMEENVIGAILLHKKAFEKIEDVLIPEMFYKEPHRLIFESCLALRAKATPIDISIVCEHLAGRGLLEAAGGMYALMGLVSSVASDANILHHANTIIEKFKKREAIKIGDKMVNDGFDETIVADTIYDECSKALTTITVGQVETIHHMPDLQMKGLARIESRMKDRIQMLKDGRQVMIGIPCGLTEVDSLTKGWRDGQLIIKAARPGVGKTSGACGDAIAAAESGAIVAFFSLEMSIEELEDKIIGAKTRISPSAISEGDIDVEGLRKIQAAWETTVGIHIDDTPGVSLRHIRSVSRGLRLKYPNKKLLIIIDYLQLMGNDESVKGRLREQEVATISKGLKELAKRLKCPIIALSQMSRAVDTRGGDKKPILSDLRESGAIEQDADIVIFHYRASMYGLTQYEDGSPTYGTGEYLIKKHRGGMLKDVMLGWEPWCRGWVNMNDQKEIEDTPFPDPRRAVPIVRNPSEPNTEQGSGGGDFFPF